MQIIYGILQALLLLLGSRGAFASPLLKKIFLCEIMVDKNNFLKVWEEI